MKMLKSLLQLTERAVGDHEMIVLVGPDRQGRCFAHRHVEMRLVKRDVAADDGDRSHPVAVRPESAACRNSPVGTVGSRSPADACASGFSFGHTQVSEREKNMCSRTRNDGDEFLKLPSIR